MGALGPSGTHGEVPRSGYYPDPSIPGYIRYWNGSAWVPGTSRPEPREGEPMPAPPPVASSPSAPAAPSATPPTAPAAVPGAGARTSSDETGPVFLDEVDGLESAYERPEAAPGATADPSGGPDASAPAAGAPEPTAPAPGAEADSPHSGSGPAPSAADPRAGSGGRVPAQQPGPSNAPSAHAPSEGAASEGAPPVPDAPAPGGRERTVGLRRSEVLRAGPAEAGDAPAAGPAHPAAAPAADSPTTSRLRPVTPPQQRPPGSEPPLPGTAGDPATSGAPGTPGTPGAPAGSGAADAPGAPQVPGQAPSRAPGQVPPQTPGQGGSAPRADLPAQSPQAAEGQPAPAAAAPPAVQQRPVQAQDPATAWAGRAEAPQAPAAPTTRAAVPADPQSAPLPAQQPPAAPQSAPGAPAAGQPEAPTAHGVPPYGPLPPAAPGALPAQPQSQPQPGAPETVTPWRPPAADPFAQARQQLRPAGLGRRFAARLVDLVLTLAVGAAVAFPFVGKVTDHIDAKVHAVEQAGETRQVWLLDGTTGGYLALVLAALLVFGFVYEVLPTARWGRTLGKRLFGLSVARVEGQDTPGLGASAVRWLVYGVLGVLVVGVVNLVWCVFDRPWRQCWHDKLVGTFVARGGAGEIRL
ncbi:RDD family protein [Streptomyces cacaoi]